MAGGEGSREGAKEGRIRSLGGNKCGDLYKCEGGKHSEGTRNHPKWLKPRGAEA